MRGDIEEARAVHDQLLRFLEVCQMHCAVLIGVLRRFYTDATSSVGTCLKLFGSN